MAEASAGRQAAANLVTSHQARELSRDFELLFALSITRSHCWPASAHVVSLSATFEAVVCRPAALPKILHCRKFRLAADLPINNFRLRFRAKIIVSPVTETHPNKHQ